MKHIRFEWLKLRKHKLHMLVLLCLIILPILVVKKGYDQLIEAFNFPMVTSAYKYSMDGEIEYVIDDGVKYYGFDAILREDELDHAQAGYDSEAWRIETTRISNEKVANMKQEKKLDEEQMKNIYGENWKQLYELAQKQMLTYGEYREALGEHFAGGTVVDVDRIMPSDEFHLYYDEAYEIELDSIRLLYKSFPTDYWDIYHKDKYLITREKLLDIEEYNQHRIPLEKPILPYPDIFKEIDVNSSDEKIAYLNNQFLNQSLYQDGRKAFEFFQQIVQAMKTYLPWILILFGILLSGIFNQEYTHKTDQTMRAMKQGNAPQAKAKLSLSLALFSGFSLYCVLLMWLVPQVMIGYHSLEIVGSYSYIWSAGYEMMLVCGFFITAMLFYYAILMLLSAYANTKFIAMLSFVFIIVITCYGGEIAGMINPDWASISTSLPGGYFVAPYDVELIDSFGFVYERCYVLLALFAGSAIVMIALTYRHYCRREIVNA